MKIYFIGKPGCKAPIKISTAKIHIDIFFLFRNVLKAIDNKEFNGAYWNEKTVSQILNDPLAFPKIYVGEAAEGSSFKLLKVGGKNWEPLFAFFMQTEKSAVLRTRRNRFKKEIINGDK